MEDTNPSYRVALILIDEYISPAVVKAYADQHPLFGTLLERPCSHLYRRNGETLYLFFDNKRCDGDIGIFSKEEAEAVEAFAQYLVDRDPSGVYDLLIWSNLETPDGDTGGYSQGAWWYNQFGFRPYSPSSMCDDPVGQYLSSLIEPVLADSFITDYNGDISIHPSIGMLELYYAAEIALFFDLPVSRLELRSPKDVPYLFYWVGATGHKLPLPGVVSQSYRKYKSTILTLLELAKQYSSIEDVEELDEYIELKEDCRNLYDIAFFIIETIGNYPDRLALFSDWVEYHRDDSLFTWKHDYPELPRRIESKTVSNVLCELFTQLHPCNEVNVHFRPFIKTIFMTDNVGIGVSVVDMAKRIVDILTDNEPDLWSPLVIEIHTDGGEVRGKCRKIARSAFQKGSVPTLAKCIAKDLKSESFTITFNRRLCKMQISWGRGMQETVYLSPKLDAYAPEDSLWGRILEALPSSQIGQPDF